MEDILETKGVLLNDGTFTELLTNLQGNILKHHGRTHAYHLFIEFNPESLDEAKAWILDFATTKITNSDKQLKDAEARHEDPEFDGGPFFNLSLSAAGYKKLGVSGEMIPEDAAFNAGMKERTGITADNLDKWESSLKQEIDALILIADGNVSTVTSERNEIIAQVSAFSKLWYFQKGKILRNKHGIGIEHFGYADGVSQPEFLKPANPLANQWDDDGADLNTLLVKEPGSDANFGSYLVFRKLEQNVLKFNTSEETLPPVKNDDGDDDDELADAMIVGRFEDGTEVINNSEEADITDPDDLKNDFDYRDDAPGSTTNGSKCPFHAHIRITNPRADVTQDFAKSVRLTRRGIPYNDIGRDEFDLEKDQPTGGVGLLFMCYQSSIVNQFEFIQSRWANNGEIEPGRPVGQDAIIGQGASTMEKFLPGQWGIDANSQQVPATFGEFVTMRGGEYFFTPSISFLKNL